MQRPLRIGWDLDGVAWDFPLALKTVGLLMGYDSDDMPLPATTWDFFTEVWGWSKKDFVNAWNYGVSREMFAWHGPTTPGFVGALRRVKAAGHENHIVTARGLSRRSEVAEQTLRWLEEIHAIEMVDSISFAGDKAPYARVLDSFIDDAPKHFEEMRGGTARIFLQDMPYNQHVATIDGQRVTTIEAYLDRMGVR